MGSVAEFNRMLIDRIKGVAATPSTVESDNDPRNPSLSQENVRNSIIEECAKVAAATPIYAAYGEQSQVRMQRRIVDAIRALAQ